MIMFANKPRNLLLSCTTPWSRPLVAVCALVGCLDRKFIVALVRKGSLAAQENLGGIWSEGKDTLYKSQRKQFHKPVADGSDQARHVAPVNGFVLTVW